jgi:hypothetical protein
MSAPATEKWMENQAMSENPRRLNPILRRRLLRYGALSLALGGTGFLGWSIGTCKGEASPAACAASRADAAPEPAAPVATAPKTEAAPAPAPTPSTPKAAPAPVAKVSVANTPAEKNGPVEKTTAVLRPKGTRGADAVVRWRSELAEGLELLEAGQPAEAQAWVGKQGLTDGPAQALEARALLALERFDEARKGFESCRTDAACAADSALGVALCEARGKLDAIPTGQLEDLLASKTASWGTGMAAYAYALHLPENPLLNGARIGDGLAKGKVEELQRYYLQKALLTRNLPLATERDCAKRLDELTARIILNPRRAHLLEMPKAALHRVAPGESLTSLGKQYDVNIGRICRLNGIGAKGVLIAGKTVKVLQGPALIQVDRWRLTATLLIDGVFIKQYPVGIGPDDKTPSGSFTIRKKVVNPDWYYEGKRYASGSAENILGARWLGFDTEEDGGRGAGLGIHGTTLPESVPGRESKGCVRMLNADVEELYDLVPQGAVVEVN